MRSWARFCTAGLLCLSASALVAAPAAERQQKLLHLLKHDCGSCHGMTLKGGLGPALLPQDLAGKADLMLIETILQGRPGTAMPPWKTMLSREEVSWLITRLRKGVDDAR